MTLYSDNGQRPAPLPFRITLPDGFTRTDPSTFTAEEIQSAGFTGPYTEPDYDPATERLDWIEGSYVVRTLPPSPPQSDWGRFKGTLLTNPASNAALASAMPQAPGAVLALPAALMAAAATGDWADFRAAWLILRRADLVPNPVLDAITQLAQSCNLPEEFVLTLGGQLAPLTTTELDQG